MIDLEALREVFKDDRTHIALARVHKVVFMESRAHAYVDCHLIPEMMECRAKIAWDSVGSNGVCGDLPEQDDLVLVACGDGEPDHTYIVKRLSSAQAKLPTQLKEGHFVMKARDGKKLILGSGTKVEIGKGTSELTEPLVLGAVLKTLIDGIFNAFLNATQIGQSAMGPVMIDPSLRSQLQTLQQNYVDTASSNFLSQTAFTER